MMKKNVIIKKDLGWNEKKEKQELVWRAKSLAYGFGAQLIGPIQLHVKRQNSSICKFFQDIAWTFFCL